jgi:hypothetical protein
MSFTQEDDFAIGDLKEEMGPKWTKIAALIGGGRSGLDIMNRFHSVHRALRSGESKAKHKEHRKWTKEEDQIIQDGLAEHRNKRCKWSIIAKLLGEDRDGNAVKNRAGSKEFLKAAGSAMAAAASEPAILTNDELTDVVPRAAKKVKFTIPPSFVDGGVAGVLNGGPPPLELSLSSPVQHADYDGETETMLELPPLPELVFSSPAPHADIDSFDFTVSNVDFDENDDTVVVCQYLSEDV